VGAIGTGFVAAAPNLSGTFVTPQTALSLVAYYAAINVLSRDVATPPLGVYRKRADGGHVLDEGFELNDVLSMEANPNTSSLKFTLDSMGHTLGYGNGLAEIRRDSTDGTPTELHLLHPQKVVPKFTTGGVLFYEDRETHQTYLAEDVLHFAGLGFNGIEGFSPASIARQSIGLGIAQDQFGAAFYGNSAVPGGALKHPKKLGPAAQDNLRASFNEIHQGSQSAHQLLILEEGMEWVQTMVSPEDAQFLAGRAFTVLEMARLFAMPPHKLGDYSEAHHTNVEEANLEYLSMTLSFWLRVREHELNRKCLTRRDRKKWVILHDMQMFLRGNTAARMAKYQTMRNLGCYSADDILRREGENPIGAEKGGDQYLIQSQYIPLNQVGKKAPDGAESARNGVKPGRKPLILGEFERIGTDGTPLP
jgi:HK97 family phage portal protein